MRWPKQVKMERTTQLLPHILIVLCLATMQNACGNTTIPFHVGVVLDMGTLVGKMGWTSISMAIDDFYALHSNYTSRLVLHPRDSKNDVVQAAASGICSLIFSLVTLTDIDFFHFQNIVFPVGAVDICKEIS